MEITAQAKIKRYILMLAAFVAVLLACCTAIAISSIQDNLDTAANMNEISESATYLNAAQLSFERTRLLCRDLLIHAGDAERMAQIQGDIFGNMEKINASLNNFAVSVVTAQEHEMLSNVFHLLDGYNMYLAQLIDLSHVNDTMAMSPLLEDNASLDTEIYANLQMLIDMSQEFMHINAAEAARRGNTIVITLIMVSVAALVLIPLAVIFIFSAISKIPDAESFNEPASAPPNDGFVLWELEACVSELKAVAYDLNAAAKKIKER